MRTRCLFCMLIAFPFVLLTNIGAAQEGPPSQFEHIKGLEPFVGVWQGEIPSPSGEAQPLTMSCRLTANKSYATFNLSGENEGERMNLGMIVVGMDAPKQQLTMWSFWPDRQSKGNASIEDDKLSFSGKGPLKDGTEVTADVSFEVSGDELSIKIRNSRRGDDEQPDRDLTLKRRERRQSSDSNN